MSGELRPGAADEAGGATTRHEKSRRGGGLGKPSRYGSGVGQTTLLPWQVGHLPRSPQYGQGGSPVTATPPQWSQTPVPLQVVQRSASLPQWMQATAEAGMRPRQAGQVVSGTAALLRRGPMPGRGPAGPGDPPDRLPTAGR